VVATLNRLAVELGPISLLTVSEVNMKWLNSVRGRLNAHVHLAVPTEARLESVLDKSRTLAIARQIGLRTPDTFEVNSLDELRVLAGRIAFPAVLKWRDANAIAHRLSTLRIAYLKAEYVDTPDELIEVGKRYAPLDRWPLIQEYCPGYGLGQFFFMHEGQAIRRFQHRRIAEWPPEGGFSSVCESVPLDQHVDLQARSIALLQALGWDGVAMVEYRYDPAKNLPVLMEVNGRFWGSLPLAVAAGAGFALLSHAAAVGDRLPPLGPAASHLRCRMISTEVKRLFRLWFARGRIADRRFEPRPLWDTLRFLADFIRPRVCYYVWAADDPVPLLRDLANLFRFGAWNTTGGHSPNDRT
jgi:predicted ATP-grasp superfamily ATP-dependent carboligase